MKAISPNLKKLTLDQSRYESDRFATALPSSRRKNVPSFNNNLELE